MATNPPAFQFYPGDFLADANVAAMTLDETGAYIRLLSYCWIEGAIPSDERQLARLLKVPVSRVRKLWPALSPCFTSDGNGALVQPRLDKERAKQLAYRAKMARWGKKGGRPKGTK